MEKGGPGKKNTRLCGPLEQLGGEGGRVGDVDTGTDHQAALAALALALLETCRRGRGVCEGNDGPVVALAAPQPPPSAQKQRVL